LLWVKENLQESWSMAFRWMDLSDWLSYRATGDDTRSLCTTGCKWTYLGHAHMHQVNEKDSRTMEACGWDDEFLEEIGLGDLIDGHHAKIGNLVNIQFSISVIQLKVLKIFSKLRAFMSQATALLRHVPQAMQDLCTLSAP
ncbi:unnamed protein product, partial [Cuscuta campestris]